MYIEEKPEEVKAKPIVPIPQEPPKKKIVEVTQAEEDEIFHDAPVVVAPPPKPGIYMYIYELIEKRKEVVEEVKAVKGKAIVPDVIDDVNIW